MQNKPADLGGFIFGSKKLVYINVNDGCPCSFMFTLTLILL